MGVECVGVGEWGWEWGGGGEEYDTLILHMDTSVLIVSVLTRPLMTYVVLM